MYWKYSWIVVCVTMGISAAAMAQQPNSYGLPGYPLAPSGPAMPFAPMPPGMPYGPGPANMPYGYPQPMIQYRHPQPMPMPISIPPDPRMPLGQRLPSVPVHLDGGPKPGATEPYLVQPESPPSKIRQPVAETKPGKVVVEAFDQFVEFVASPEPTEPYTMYEGRRYQAEMRHENTRVWAQVNFIHWWVRGDNTPPLLTTPDSLANPNTTILLADSIGPKEFSGLQATFGQWLDEERLQSLEIGGFWVGRNSRQYRFASDENGSPQLVQPITVGGIEQGIAVTQPGSLAGSFSASSALDFHSLELNIARNVLRLNGWSVDSIVGIRYLYMNDNLSLDQSFTVLPGGAGFIPFNNVVQPAGANFAINDTFNMTNRFYGGQIGARINWTCGRFDLGTIVKVGLGATAHTAVIDGSSTLNVNGASTTLPGGILAQASNSGRHTSTDFSVVPEVIATVGFQVTCNLRVLVGYNFLDWSRIQRASGQIEREIDLGQVPTFGAAGVVGTSPRFPGIRTDFWAQGVNVGMELKY